MHFLVMRMQPTSGSPGGPVPGAAHPVADQLSGRVGDVSAGATRAVRRWPDHAADRRGEFVPWRAVRLRQVDHPAAGQRPGASRQRRHHRRWPRGAARALAGRHGFPEIDHAAWMTIGEICCRSKSSSPFPLEISATAQDDSATERMRCWSSRLKGFGQAFPWPIVGGMLSAPISAAR